MRWSMSKFNKPTTADLLVSLHNSLNKPTTAIIYFTPTLSIQ